MPLVKCFESSEQNKQVCTETERNRVENRPGHLRSLQFKYVNVVADIAGGKEPEGV